MPVSALHLSCLHHGLPAATGAVLAFLLKILKTLYHKTHSSKEIFSNSVSSCSRAAVHATLDLIMQVQAQQQQQAQLAHMAIVQRWPTKHFLFGRFSKKGKNQLQDSNYSVLAKPQSEYHGLHEQSST